MDTKLKIKLENFVFFIEWLVKKIISLLLRKKAIKRRIHKGDFKSFPIFIISYNRLSYVKQTVEWLQRFGYNNINIIDNHSDYPPLVEYLKKCDCRVYWMKKNWGHRVFFKNPRFFFIRNFSFFAISDPDLSPVDECPADFVEVFMNILNRYPNYSKVGFSLKIDDLPDVYSLKSEVIAWEKRFYEKILESETYSLYDASLDTTFAVEFPMIFVSEHEWYKAIRVGMPYQVRHLPWYGEFVSEELLHYQRTIRKDVSNWNGNFSKEQIKNRYSL